MGRCFVPGCNSGSYESRKKNKEAGVKNPSLFKPQHSLMLDKWNEVIQGKDREMCMKDTVCELHFEEKFISRYFKQKMPDGTFFILKRVVNCLQPGAVPTIFPGSVNQDKFNLMHQSSSESMDIDERMMEVGSDNIIKVENEDESDAINPLRFDTLVFDFNYLVKNLHSIQKPTSSWTVSFISETHSKYVICAMWINYLAAKRIVIDTSLNIKVFLKDKQVDSIENDKVNSIDDIYNLLEKVSYYDLCPGMEKGSENCLKFFDRRFQFGRLNKWCSYCNPKRKQMCKKNTALSDKAKLKKSCEKYSLLAKRFELMRKQKNTLTKRVQRLSTRLKFFKEYHDSF